MGVFFFVGGETPAVEYWGAGAPRPSPTEGAVTSPWIDAEKDVNDAMDVLVPSPETRVLNFI